MESSETRELRQNKITKEWVIYSPSRRNRPKDYQKDGDKRPPEEKKDPGCPFCPGNEDQLPEILSERSHPYRETWQTRVVPNTYPALTPGDRGRRGENVFYRSRSGHGYHEVLIESSRHDTRLFNVTQPEMENVIAMYYSRYDYHRQRERASTTILFRNHGARAGTSLRHPHAQLISMNVVPQSIRNRESQARQYYDDFGQCLYCSLIEKEREEGMRQVQENEHFISLVPYFASSPYELWILPKMHQCDFSQVDDGEISDLASVLQDALKRYHRLLEDPDYNYVFQNAAHKQDKKKYFHWSLHIFPRLTSRAGFEIGSGMRINSSLPEKDAHKLRSTDIR